MANSGSGDSMLARIVRILSAFDTEHPMLGVESLAARANLPVSTAYRITSEMIAFDLLQKDADGRLRVGVGMWELANRTSEVMTLGRIARPHMVRVNSVIGEHTQLCIMRDHEVLYLERVSAPTAGPNIASVGGRLPAHASAAGLVLLAQQPAHTREAYLSGPHTAVTQHTVVAPDALRSMLAGIRKTGFAKLVGSMVEKSTAFAVPVREPQGTTIAALACVVDRDDHLPEEQIRSLLTAASQAIARDYGDRPGVRAPRLPEGGTSA